MAIGEDGDFRTVGFRQTMRFPGQGTRGGPGSPFLPSLTPPAGTVNSLNPVPLLTLPSLGSSTFTLPAFPNLPTITPFNPSVGGDFGTGTTTITVIDNTTGTPTTYTGIDTVEVTGDAVVTPVGSNQVTIEVVGGGGGGGGTTLKYAKITGSSKIVSTEARWSYTVVIYTAGVAAATSVTAYNLLENENTSSSAYGYAVTGGDRVTGTSYYIRAVPTDTWIRMEQTSDITGTPTYWFSAPNFMDGTC